MKIYLAGPDVFRPDAVQHGKLLKSICKDKGYEGLFPFDNEVDTSLKGKEAARAIFEANKKMIEEADVVIANLVPFRGPSADVGTVWEVAYALGLGKRVIGYRDCPVNFVPSIYKDRVEDDKYFVEDFGLGDNLMIDMSIPIAKSFIQALEEVKKHESTQTN